MKKVLSVISALVFSSAAFASGLELKPFNSGSGSSAGFVNVFPGTGLWLTAAAHANQTAGAKIENGPSTVTTLGATMLGEVTSFPVLFSVSDNSGHTWHFTVKDLATYGSSTRISLPHAPHSLATIVSGNPVAIPYARTITVSGQPAFTNGTPVSSISLEINGFGNFFAQNVEVNGVVANPDLTP